MFRKFFVISLVAVVVVAGLMFVGSDNAAAQQRLPADDGRTGFTGIVTSYEGDELVVQVKQLENESLTFIVDDATTIKTPGPESIAGILEESARVGILATDDGKGGWQATQILVKPTEPTVEALNGVVLSRDGSVMTVELPNGDTRELELQPGDEILEPGDVITAFARKSGRAGGRPQVTGLAKADSVRERIQDFMNQTFEGRPDDPAAVADAREKLAEQLSLLLERHTERHTELIQRVLGNDNLTDDKRRRIQTALESAQERMETARQRIQTARDRIREARERRGLSGG
jgi:hypothetical protein